MSNQKRDKDIERILEFINSYSLDTELAKSLKHITESKPSNPIERAKQSSYIRTFLITFIKEIAEKIAQYKKEEIPKIKDGVSDAKYKSFLKSQKILTEQESQHLNSLYSLLSEASGSHKLSTSKEKYRFMFVASLEMILLILSRAKPFLPREEFQTKSIPAITKSQFNRLMEKVKIKHHRLAFFLAFTSGLDISDIISLQRNDINLEKDEILVKGDKRLKERIVPLNNSFKKEHLKILPIKCKSRALQKAFKKYAKESGLLIESPKLQFRSLRKGFAREARMNGHTDKEIQSWLGHLNISSTAELLDEIDKDKPTSFKVEI